MTTTVQTPKSSVKSSSAMEDGSSCCRRDANCECKICLASFNATLDLLPVSAQRSSLTKLSSSKPSRLQTPLSFHPSTTSISTSPPMVSPPLNSTLRTDFRPKFKRKNIKSGYRLMVMKCVLILFLIWAGKLGYAFITSTLLKTKLSPEIVRTLSDISLGFQGMEERLGFLYNELQNFVGNSFPEASSTNTNWEIIQDGLILRSRRQLYKSWLEEVSIWGWPLQTAGLFTTDQYSSRSFTILSGRITEWPNGEFKCLSREANDSWEQRKWITSVWRLDENTWILEYKRSFVFEDTRPFWLAMEFLKFNMMRGFQWVKQLWKLSDGNHITPT